MTLYLDPTRHHVKAAVDTASAEIIGQLSQDAHERASRVDAPRDVKCKDATVTLSIDERNMVVAASEAPVRWPVDTAEEMVCRWLVDHGLLKKLSDTYVPTKLGLSLVAEEAGFQEECLTEPDYFGALRDDKGAAALVRGGLPG